MVTRYSYESQQIVALSANLHGLFTGRTATCYASEKPAWPDQTRSFLLDFPIEIRDIIYFVLLRSDLHAFGDHADWRNASGSTKVSQLNKQMCHEARAVLDCYVNTIALLGNGQHSFRNMLSQGKFNMFHMEPEPPARFIPRSDRELQFLHLRKVTIYIRYPVRTRGLWDNVATFDVRSAERLTALKWDFSELTAAVEKSKAPVALQLEFQTGVVKYEYEEGVVYSGAFINNENPEMIEMLHLVVDAARRNKVCLTAKEDKMFETQSTRFRDETYRDPLAQYVNDARGLGDAPTDTTTANTSKTIWTQRESCSLVIYPLSTVGTSARMPKVLPQFQDQCRGARASGWNAVAPHCVPQAVVQQRVAACWHVCGMPLSASSVGWGL